MSFDDFTPIFEVYIVLPLHVPFKLQLYGHTIEIHFLLVEPHHMNAGVSTSENRIIAVRDNFNQAMTYNECQ